MAQNKVILGEKTIETPSLTVKKNIMVWENTMIQLSNVSYISASSIEDLPFPMWTLLPIIAGLLIMIKSFLIGLLIAAIGIFAIYLWSKENDERTKGAILTISMNSGNKIHIRFEDKGFLNEVTRVLEDIIINGGAKSPIEINIKGNQIIDSNILDNIRM